MHSGVARIVGPTICLFIEWPGNCFIQQNCTVRMQNATLFGIKIAMWK